MFDVKTIIENIFNSKIAVFSERVTICEIELFPLKKHFPTYKHFIECFSSISFGNDITVEMIDPDEHIICISSNDLKNEKYYNDYISNLEDDDNIQVKINIKKRIVDNRIYIYNYLSFVEDILNNSIEEMMVIFSKFLKNRDNIIFQVLDTNVFLSTKTMMFTNNDSCFSNTIDRKSVIELSTMSSFFQNTGNFELIPEDFDIISSIKENPFEETFNQIRTILSLCYISSSSIIDEGRLKGVINGQRSLSFEYTLNNVNNNKVIYDIYSWIFNDGHYADKAVIARNIISLHCKYCSILDVSLSVFSSITSSFAIYLRENVAQFLEAKTKAAEFASDLGNKILDSAFELLRDFKKNVVAISSFILTVVLVNIVSENPLEMLFTKEITSLIEIVLVGSIVFFIISFSQTKTEIKRIQNNYCLLRANYSSILSEGELQEIFDNNELYNQNEKYIKQRIIIFSILWIAFVIFCFIVVELLSDEPVIISFIKKVFIGFKSLVN